MPPPLDDVAVVVLAGGLGRRLGGDKARHVLAGTPLLQHVLARMAGQAAAIAFNANDPSADFAAAGLPVLPDPVPGRPGPLAGILAGLLWARTLPGVRDVVSVPVDCPFLPRDLVRRLHRARGADPTRAACAASGRRRHPVVGLWPVALADALRHAIEVEGLRRAETWAARHVAGTADYPAEPVDAFLNVNTPADLDAAARLIALGTVPD